MVPFTEARDATGAQAAITLVPGWIIGGVAVDVEVRAGVAAVGPAVPARHRPVAKGGHLPADLLAANVTWRGQFPSHVLAVLVGFLVQVPDFDDLLGGISVGIAAWEVRRVQVFRQRRPDGEAELEQVLERQTERRNPAIDVAGGEARPRRSTIAVGLDALDLHRPGRVFVSLPPDRFRRQLVGVGAGFDQIQRVAKALSASTLVPVQYRAFAEVKEYGKVTGYTPNGAGLPNCIVALNMAQRMGADPLMVMQNLYVIEGRPSWSSQFIIASINSCGRFNPLRYDLSQPGKEQEVSYKATTWKNKQKVEETRTIKVRHQTCTAWTTERGVQIPTFSPEELRKKSMLQLCREYGVPVIESPEVSIQMALDEGWLTKNGSKWQTMPEVMLRYRAASLLGRLYAPELLMGLQTVEEVNDFIEPRDTDIQGETVTVHVDDLRDKEPAPPAVAAEDDGDEPSPPDGVNTETGEITEPAPGQQSGTVDTGTDELNLE